MNSVHDPPAPPTIPPENCFWALVPRDAGPSLRRILYAAESQFPVPIESLHVAFAAPATVPGDGTTHPFLVVAIDRARLENHLAKTDLRDAETLIPGGLPPLIPVAPYQASLPRLNLLHGSFEPPKKRAWRRHVLVLGLATLNLSLCLGLLGMERRRMHAQASSLAAETAINSQIEAGLPASPTSSLQPELRLLAATRQLATLEKQIAESRALTLAMDSFHAGIPPDLSFRINHAECEPTRMRIEGVVEQPSTIGSVTQAFSTISIDGRPWAVAFELVNRSDNNDEELPIILTLTPKGGIR